MSNVQQLKTLPFPYFNNWTDKNFKNSKYDVKWLRPHEICNKPLFYSKNGPSRNDVIQGIIGDCWIIGPISNLPLNPEMLAEVIPEGQGFERDKYTGTFHFRFHSLTGWKDVYVDDTLPTVDGRLIFAHSRKHNIFWAPLLEKAYVKFVGCYENVNKGGVLSVSNYHFTGLHSQSLSLGKRLWLKPDPFRVLQILTVNFGAKSLLSCSPKHKNRAVGNVLFQHDHVYNITGLKLRRSDLLKSKIRLKTLQGNVCRLKKPPIMIESNETTEVYKVKIGNIKTYLDNQRGDEFYISFESFVKLMDSVKICGRSKKGVTLYDKFMNFALIAIQNIFIKTYS